MKKSIYIADDHQIVVDGLMLLLRDEEDFVIAGYANNGQVALDQILKLKPDIALLDIRMPEKDGLEVTRYIREKNLSTKIILLSMHSDKRYVNDAKHFGADGYLLKNAGKQEMMRAIEQVLSGHTYFTRIEENGESNQSKLTPRELDILRLLVNELTTIQIADKLVLSSYTIETHRKNILKKTGAKNLAGLVKYAIENRLDMEG